MSGKSAEDDSPEEGQASERSDEQLRIALEAAQLLSWDWNLETGAIHWAGTIPSFMALPHTIPRPAEAPPPLVWPADRERVRQAALQALETGATTTVEFRLMAGGQLRWVAAAGRAYRDARGQTARIVGVLRDVTAQKKAEVAVGLGARILDGVHDAVISTGPDGRIRTWNLAAQRMYGYAPEEAIGQPLAFLWAPEEAAEVEDAVLGPTRRARLHEVAARHRRRDGTAIAVELRLTLLRDDELQDTDFIACVNDITERVRVQEALQQQREDLQVILDSVPAFIWYKDRDNRILRANRRALESMRAPLAGEGVSTYDLYPDEAAKYHDDDREVIRTGQPKLGIIEPLAMPSGEKLWVRTDKVPYRNPAGDIVGVIVFAVDITERVQAEEQLRLAHDELERRVAMRTRDLQDAVHALQSEIGERERAEARMREHQGELAHVLRLRTVEGMAAQLAHELNQPLSAIINFASGLTRRLASGTTPADALARVSEDIGREAMRAAAVVQRLREFVRKGPPRRETCNLREVIGNALLLMDADLKRERISTHFDLGNGRTMVVGDPIQIEQVVLNLLRNALQAIEEAPAGPREIALETVCNGELIEVRVRDTGIGLPAQGGEDLFEPFFTTKKHGLGMGLSISRSILEAHGGTLSVTPNRPRGAVFVFTLPLCR